ncbi:MAG: hypothetical protein M1818_004255 [Claussenomyces sp. TS43310]|nr:MAG: hypothetical protein M1818_004255 [Claussenomyces sp. TS43310]
MALQPSPPARSTLGRYRLLSPSAAVRVSPLCLGAMNFGNAWTDILGGCDQKTTEDILDYFYEKGGNFIDTANNYQSEESEKWLGEWMKKRNNRDQMVIATKYTSPYRAGHAKDEIVVNSVGNGAKSLHTSVNASLKKMQTDYIDLLYVHWWDYQTSIEEVMRSLNNLVAAGKVLYLGISDTPAWIVSKANQYARDHGLSQFVVYQGKWSAESRDFERDILHMCADEKMGLCPWGALGGGQFKTEEQLKSDDRRKWGPQRDSATRVSKVLERIAKKKNTLLTSIALAYVMHKTPYVFPIVGGRKVEHLKGNIEALSLELSDADIEEIESATPEFDIGFPQSAFSMDPKKNFVLSWTEPTDYVEGVKPIPPQKEDK